MMQPLLDPAKVEYYRFVREWTVGEFKENALLTDELLQKIEKRRPISMAKARTVASALGVPLLEILNPAQRRELMSTLDPETSSMCLPDWSVEVPVRGPVETSNGLVYYVWKMEHVLEKGRLGEKKRYGRGKRYDLHKMRTDDQERLSAYLARHGDVCNKVYGSRFFPRHVTTAPASGRVAWWSVDEWTDGVPLADLIYHDRVPAQASAAIMRNLAEALQLLHSAGIICRELSTQSVIVTEPSEGAVVVTDFELGKLLDGSPTVRGDGPGNPFRAKEVDGKTLTKDDTHVDWYSWGRILLHVVTGGLPRQGWEGPCLQQAELPDQVLKITARCLSPDPRVRPRRADEILKSIRKWK